MRKRVGDKESLGSISGKTQPTVDARAARWMLRGWQRDALQRWEFRGAVQFGESNRV